VLTGVVIAAFVANAFPKAFAIVAAVLVVVFLLILRKVLRTKRKIEHKLIARRADKQNAAYLRGKDRGVYGKYSPEDLD
jgi:hypothetical protein